MHKLLNDPYKDNRDTIIDKWMPIIDTKFKDSSMKKKELMCIYAEQHTIINTATSGVMLGNPPHFTNPNDTVDDNSSEMLMMSFRIINKLDIDDKNVQIVSLPKFVIKDEITGKTKETMVPTMQVQNKLSMEEVQELKANGENLEETLLDDLVIALNSKLRYYDSLFIYLVINSISVISEATFAPVIALRTRVQFEDRNNTPERTFMVDKNDIGISKIEEIEPNMNFIKTTDTKGNEFWIDIETNQVLNESILLESELMGLMETYKNNISQLNSSINEIKSKL